MTRKPIDYEQITNELMREIKESFQSNKTGRTYLKSLKVKTTSPTKRSKMEYIELLEKNKETGEIEINEKRIKMMINNKKLPGEKEQEFKNKIIKSLKIEFSQVTFTDKGTSSKKRTITGKEWEKLRKQQTKTEDKKEQRPIGSIPGSIKNIEKQLSKTPEDRALEQLKSRRRGAMTSIRNAFAKGINKDFDILNREILKLLEKISDSEFKKIFSGRSDDFYLSIFSSDEDIIMNSYVEIAKDLFKTQEGKKFIDNLKTNNPLYKYLKDLNKIDDLFNNYKNKSLNIRTRPIIFE